MFRSNRSAALRRLATALVLALPVAAQAQWSVGARGGALDVFLDGSEFQRELAERGHAVSVTADHESSGGALSLIWALGDTLDAEFALNLLPASQYQVTGAIPDPQALADDMADIIAGQGTSASFALRARIPVAGARWLLTPRLGVSAARSEVTLNSGGQRFNAEETGTGLLMGVGGQYRLTPTFSLGGGWDLFRYSGQNNMGFWHLDLEMRFGAR